MLQLSEILTLLALSCQVHTGALDPHSYMKLQTECIRTRAVCALNDWNAATHKGKVDRFASQVVYLNCLDK